VDIENDRPPAEIRAMIRPVSALMLPEVDHLVTQSALGLSIGRFAAQSPRYYDLQRISGEVAVPPLHTPAQVDGYARQPSIEMIQVHPIELSLQTTDRLVIPRLPST
jgi:hypothetical protein